MFSHGHKVTGLGGRALPAGGRNHFLAVFAPWQPNDESDVPVAGMVRSPWSRPFRKCRFQRCEVKNEDFMREKPLYGLSGGGGRVRHVNDLKS